MTENMSDTNDESLVGLTGGPLASDNSEEPIKESDSNSSVGRRAVIVALTEKVTSSYDFKTFADTKEIHWYDNKLGIYRSNGESIIEVLVE